ncbi:hypothetical protein PPMP20_00430 [Paraburkholderia phymatum]|uniref:hypothetical protein n=1 Tax=Paraburkholderia phymatum TaxID=148447 RepID=UPI00031B58E3|nr:hypothetical protein [Paraburkholderia phymatum]
MTGILALSSTPGGPILRAQLATLLLRCYLPNKKNEPSRQRESEQQPRAAMGRGEKF